jgi:hypothetical protein
MSVLSTNVHGGDGRLGVAQLYSCGELLFLTTAAALLFRCSKAAAGGRRVRVRGDVIAGDHHNRESRARNLPSGCLLLAVVGCLTQGSIPMDFAIGAIVDINLGRGVVRFHGPTSFSPGKWVGIELSEPVGKNDGSVKGISYFSCQTNHGVFVKPSQVKLTQDLPPTASVSPLHFSQIMS